MASPQDIDAAAALSDTDGSESLTSVTISNVPQGVTFSAGVVNADGTVTVAAEDLDGLQMYAEESAVQSEITLTLSVGSSEASNGDSATTTTTLTIDGLGDEIGTLYGGAGGDDAGSGSGGANAVFHFALEDTSWGSNETVTDGCGGCLTTLRSMATLIFLSMGVRHRIMCSSDGRSMNASR